MSNEHITLADVEFAVVGKNEIDASIVVCFWGNGYTPQLRYNISLPIDPATGAIPTGSNLTAHIMQHAPVEQLNIEITRYKTSVIVDYSEIDFLIASGAARIPKQF